jgi:hypothetical protein
MTFAQAGAVTKFLGADERATYLSPGARLVLAAMWALATRDAPWYCTLSADKLAKRLGVSERTVQNAWTELRRVGLIEWKGGGLRYGKTVRRELLPIFGTTEHKKITSD